MTAIKGTTISLVVEEGSRSTPEPLAVNSEEVLKEAPKLISDFRLGTGREFFGIEAF